MTNSVPVATVATDCVVRYDEYRLRTVVMYLLFEASTERFDHSSTCTPLSFTIIVNSVAFVNLGADAGVVNVVVSNV